MKFVWIVVCLFVCLLGTLLCYRKKKKQLQLMDTAHANVTAARNNQS